MPKPRQRIATGLSVSDILDMPISKFQQYTPAQQREIVSRLGSAANKRLKNLNNSGIVNSATMKLDESGGKISVRGKSGDELAKELMRAREFLTNKFSSKKEWNKVIKAVSKNDMFNGKDLSQVGRVFAMYDYLRELDPEIVNRINKYTLMDYIDDLYMSDAPRESIINKSMDYIRREYKKRQDEYNTSSTLFSEALENDIPRRMSRKRKRKRR